MKDNITAEEKKQFRDLLEEYRGGGRRSRSRNLLSELYPWRNEIINALNNGARKSEIYRALIVMKVITHTQTAFDQALARGLSLWSPSETEE